MRRRSSIRARRTTAILAAGCIVASSFAVSQEGGEEAATRGITGRIVVESEHGHVRGRPDLDLDSPILVRVAARDHRPDGRWVTELEFIGVDAGVFDLRDSLVFDDGGPTERLEPLPVEIVSNLASDAPSDVFLAEAPPATIAGGYRTVLVVVAVAWTLVPVVVVVRRLLRRPPTPPVPPPSPTILDRLEPLVRRAADRQLTVDERGRLELLLHAHWRMRLGLEDDPAAAVRRIRRDPEAGRLLRRVEAWLHAPDGRSPSAAELGELLAPYGDRVPEVVS
ncbi:MAG: hypothetical protein CMJ52_09375 [Planctomycetaceae bacterium]|nr:hypothetical protein [Planctomycetaceae bacterium]